jgi:hypothetical protein
VTKLDAASKLRIDLFLSLPLMWTTRRPEAEINTSTASPACLARQRQDDDDDDDDDNNNNSCTESVI